MAYPAEAFYYPQGGDFLSQNPEPRSLADFAELSEHTKPEAIRDQRRSFNGLGRIMGIRTQYDAVSQGRTYNVLRLEPTDECAPLEHTVDTTPAFATNHDKGIFYNTAVTAMKAGFSVNMMSPETDWQSCPPTGFTAFSYLAIGDKMEQQRRERLEITPGVAQRDKMCVSRALALTIKQLELLYAFGRDPEYIEGVGAVYHKKNTVRQDINLYAKFIPCDVLPGAISAVRNPLRIPELAQTLMTTPQGLFHTATSIKALRKANVGESLRNIHPDTEGHITLLDQDIFGDQDAHAESYSHYKKITVRRVDGLHCDFAGDREQEALKSRIYARARQKRREKYQLHSA